MTDPNSPGLYCIPCCIPAGSDALLGLTPWPARPCVVVLPRGAAEGAGGAAATPRGGSTRRPGWPDETGPLPHARESKTLTPPQPCSPPIAALFVRADSVYHSMPAVDAWDATRDARRWPGGCPLIAHPPCRAWGRMRDKAQPREDEKDLARWAVAQVRTNGGVLEHPAQSTLWPDQGLPLPRSTRGNRPRDAWGGWTLPISQNWFGYRAEKLTWLYVVGCEPKDLPPFPLDLADPPRVVAQLKGRGGKPRPRKGDQGWRPEVTRTERERTTPAFAQWLAELARRCEEVAACA